MEEDGFANGRDMRIQAAAFVSVFSAYAVAANLATTLHVENGPIAISLVFVSFSIATLLGSVPVVKFLGKSTSNALTFTLTLSQ